MLHRHPFLGLLTGAYAAFVAWLTLTPQSVAASQADIVVRAVDALQRRGYVEWLTYGRLELLANIALFVPIGVFLLILFGARLWWLAVLVPFAMTCGIEYAQHYIPGRVPDQRDLVANTLGAVLGVLLGLVLTLPATLRRRRARRSALRVRRA